MARRRNISAVISLKDNMSATMRGIRREQTQFQREVRQTRNAMRSASRERMRIRMDATPAHRTITRLRRQMAPLRTKIATVVAVKDLAKEKLARINSNVKAVGRFVAKPIVKVKDAATGMINKIKGKLTSLKSVAPIAIGVTAAGASVKSGMTLEQEEISLKHFMGVGNEGKSDKQIAQMSKSFTKQLSKRASDTGLGLNEAMGAGRRAIQISGGNTKEAMKKVKLAQDMAALNPGKTISDAMEALADADVGEMERLKEFGLKASSKDDPKKVEEALQQKFGGGAEKQANSGAGMMSKIVGNVKTSMAQLGRGMLEPLKPAMGGLLGFFEKASPYIEQFGSKLTSGLGSALDWITQQVPTFAPIFSQAFSAVGSIVSTVAPIIGQVIGALSPVFAGLLSIGSMALNGIAGIVKVVAPAITTLIEGLKPGFESIGKVLQTLGKVFKSVFEGIQKVVKKAVDFVNPLIKSVTKVASSFADGFNWAVQKFAGNATGTRYWQGGVSVVGEHGPELVQMPRGSKVFSNTESKSMVRKGMPQGSSNVPSVSTPGHQISIAKLADTIVVKEEADIDKITASLVKNMKLQLMGGA